MKRIISILTALALGLCLAIPAAAAPDAQSANLKFRTDGTFKIIQVTDTQDFLLSCQVTQDFLYELAKTERPDLFVLTGDNVGTGGAKGLPKFLAKLLVKLSVENLMRAFDKIYKDFGIPMTMVFGNHDNEVGPDKVSRAEQFAMYAAHKCFIGYYIDAADKGTGDEQGQHYGTHNIVIKNSAGTAPAFNLWMFDSGSYDERGGYSSVQTAQVDWFTQLNGTLNLPSIAFQHIIVPEIFAPGVLTPEKTLPAGTVGVLRENPCPGNYNYGQYDALSAGGVLALFVGHDHVNTYELRLPGTDLINSPCTGFGAYGDIDLRGARIITLDESDLTGYETRLVTFQTFFGPNTLRRARLNMYQSMSTPATLLDWISFKPLLWLLDLFKLTPDYAPPAA